MANRYKNLIYSTAEYTHCYKELRGVDLNAGSLVSSPSRLAYSQNMYKDYDGDGADVIESIPGYRCFAKYDDKIHAIYYQRGNDEDYLIVHVGNRLMRHPVSDIHEQDAQGELITYVKDTKSFGFEYGRYYYVMDTEKMLRIDTDGACETIGDSEATPYVPTVYVSGESYEQRNLLSDEFKEEYFIADPHTFLLASKEIKYAITDLYSRYCSVIGLNARHSGEIFIPAYVDIGGENYKVTSIGSGAFKGNKTLSSVFISDGITEIGEGAFERCSALESVYMPPTLNKIGKNAFSGCTALSTVYVGEGLQTVDEKAFSNCDNLKEVHYALSSNDFIRIIGCSEFPIAATTIYESVYNQIKIHLPIRSKAEEIYEVSVDGTEYDFETLSNDEYVTGVILTFDSLTAANEVKIVAKGLLLPLDDDWMKNMTVTDSMTPYEAIMRCRIAETFDGRIFFSGNPDLPNTVFYTERTKPGQDGALYIGQYNYFNDGVGTHKVKSLLAVRDMLAVFKDGDDGSGSIFYHKREALDLGSMDTIYPVAYVHSGIKAIGATASFLDDPVFLSSEGLMALDRENINYQRNVVCRSHNVNYYLLKEDLSQACLCEWLGYLAVGINGNIFLADSRATFTHSTGSREYEWFYLTGIGGYTNDKKVYRYCADGYLDTVPHPYLVGGIASSSQVYSKTDSNGNTYYYVPKGNVKYHVAPTGERQGGQFYPATVFTSFGKLLFFGTDDGHLCIFNNDMRGIAPDSIVDSDSYDEDEYTAMMGNKIHPLYYSFAGHTPYYIIKTALDNCGIPHLTKNTVKNSLVIKAKSYSSNVIDCEVCSDNRDAVYVGSFPPYYESFDDFDFMVEPWYASRYTSVSLPENEKKWIEKQLTLLSGKFASPISIYSITYRYVIKGKIKNNAD